MPPAASTIHDLARLAARERARSIVLAEATGRWLAEADPAAQSRFWAHATSRHGWHAELWAGRFPAIPGFDLDPATAEASPDTSPLADELATTPATDRLGRYLAALDVVAVELRAQRDRLDPELDAPTARVLDLVLADVDTLRHPRSN